MLIKFKFSSFLTIAGLVFSSTAAIASNTDNDLVNTDQVATNNIYVLQDEDGFVYNYMKSNSKVVDPSDAEIILIGQDISVNNETETKINAYLAQGKTVIFDGLSTGSKASNVAMSIMKNTVQADAIVFKGSLQGNDLSMTPVMANVNLNTLSQDGDGSKNNNTVENIFPR